MQPDFTEANAVALSHIADVVAAQESQPKFTRSGYVACALVGAGLMKRAVDVYHGPEGDGYVIRFIYELDEKRWCRCEARGPQAFRTHDWKEQRTI